MKEKQLWWMICVVCSTFVSWSPTARADICDVDLSFETADEELMFDLIYGEVVDEISDNVTVAVCLSWRFGPPDAASEPVLIAYVQGGEDGVCATIAEERACDDGGCDEVEVLTRSSQNISIASGGEGVPCRVDEASDDPGHVTVGAAPFGWAFMVRNEADSNTQGFIETTTNCDYGGESTSDNDYCYAGSGDDSCPIYSGDCCNVPACENTSSCDTE